MLAEFRKVLGPVGRYRSLHHGREQHIVVESVELDSSGPEPKKAVMLRDPNRPECLFGWQRRASWPEEPVTMAVPVLLATKLGVVL